MNDNLIIYRDIYYIPSQYSKEKIIGNNLLNSYIPLYVTTAIKNSNSKGMDVFLKKHFDESYIYFLIDYYKNNLNNNNYYEHTRKYQDLYNSLLELGNSRCFYFRKEGTKHFLTVNQGIIIDSYGDILLCFCEEYDKPSYYVNEEGYVVDVYDNITILISKKFSTMKKYSSLYKKLTKEFIFHFQEKGASTKFKTSSEILNLCYNPINVKPSVKDVKQYHNGLQSYKEFLTKSYSKEQMLNIFKDDDTVPIPF